MVKQKKQGEKTVNLECYILCEKIEEIEIHIIYNGLCLYK